MNTSLPLWILNSVKVFTNMELNTTDELDANELDDFNS